MSSAVGTAVAEVYAAGLCATGDSAYEPMDWRVRYHDGAIRPLELVRGLESWPGDEQLLDRCRGSVLDVDCGPGRLTRALRARVDALGIDVAPAVVRLARRRGADVLQRSVFGAVPAPGSWRSVVLADCNVGIGGAARRLLRRVRRVLRAGGQVRCEVDRPGRAVPGFGCG
jgi:SAM-dependent methyltransferase